MIWFVLMGLFAAFGLLCALWITLGNWLTKAELETVVIHVPEGREAASAQRLLWLRDLGLAGPRFMIITTAGAETRQVLSRQFAGIVFLSPEQYLAQLEQEREKLDRI